MTPADLDAGIRERAYQLWEAAGRPDGYDLEHWLQAEAQVSGPVEPEAAAAKPKRAKKAETAEPKPAKAKKAKVTA